MRELIPIGYIALLFVSCTQHSAYTSLSSKSPDGKAMIAISGEKATSLDPFTVTLSVKIGESDQGSIQFEIASSELTDSNVKFKWADSQNCCITFIQNDGEKRIFAYYAAGTNIVVKEVKTQ